jgi:single-stranded DNA-binding protein
MSVHKGEPVLIMGRLQIRRFEDAEGAPRTAVEVEASSVGHDLTRGVAQFSRTRWPAASAAAEAAALPDGAPGSEDGAAPGDRPELADGPEPAERPNGATSGGAGTGDGIVDERAVAEFARELSESLGAAAAADPAADAAEDAGATAESGMPA